MQTGVGEDLTFSSEDIIIDPDQLEEQTGSGIASTEDEDILTAIRERRDSLGSRSRVNSFSSNKSNKSNPNGRVNFSPKSLSKHLKIEQFQRNLLSQKNKRGKQSNSSGEC